MESLCRLSKGLVGSNPEVLAVLLFGSLARGDYSRRSDADLLVCLCSGRIDRPRDRIPAFLAHFLDAPVPVDVLPLTEEEILQRIEDGRPFWLQVKREAVLLAGVAPPSLEQ